MRRGFTLIEVVIVAAIIFALAAGMTTIAFVKARETAQEKICAEGRRLIEHAEERYALAEGAHSTGLQDLVDEGYLRSLPACPAGGVYAWENTTLGDPLYQTTIACSVHGVGDVSVTEAADTGDGSTTTDTGTDTGTDETDTDTKDKKDKKDKKEKKEK